MEWFGRWLDLMMKVPNWFWFPIQQLVGHPERIAMIAAVFFLGHLLLRLFRPSVRRWPVLLPTCTWALFAPYEWYCTRHGYDKRLDLALIYPLLLVLTLVGLSLTLWSLRHHPFA
jgi:hypothetical protein